MRMLSLPVLVFLAAMIAPLSVLASEQTVNFVVNMLLLQQGDPDTGIEKSLVLRWQRPAEREDGSVLSSDELRSFQIRYRRVGSNSAYRLILLHSDTLSTGLTLQGEEGDQFEFAVRAIDTDGGASDYTVSAMVTFALPESG